MFRLNELRANTKNRVESNQLDLRLNQLEREKTVYLSMQNRELREVHEELRTIRASTDILERKMSSIRSASSIEYFSPFRAGSIFIAANVKLDDPDKNEGLYTPESMRELKRRDPVLKKRLQQMELFKKSGRAPFFDPLIEAKLERMKLTRSALDRQQRELVKMAARNTSVVPRQHTYHYVYQMRLKGQIESFVDSINSK